jgi:hypothetical protein
VKNTEVREKERREEREKERREEEWKRGGNKGMYKDRGKCKMGGKKRGMAKEGESDEHRNTAYLSLHD